MNGTLQSVTTYSQSFKLKYVILALILVFSLSFILLSGSDSSDAASIACSGDDHGMHWELDDNGVFTVSGEGYADIGSCPYSEEITKIVIEDNITTIKDYGFHQLPKLMEVVMSDSVITIDVCAFEYCPKLTKVTLSNNLETIFNQAFTNCSKLVEISPLPDSLTYLGREAFASTGITEIVIPNSIETLEEGVFNQCSKLSSVGLPSNIKEIGPHAFACTPITHIEFPKGLTKIHNAAFNNTQLTELNLPPGIVYVGISAFAGCENLTEVVLPDSLSTISNGLFYWCTNLVSVKMGNNVNWIDDLAFGQCGNLTTIVIPDSVYLIGEQAFEGCVNLQSIYFPQSLSTVYESTFDSLGLYDSDGVTPIDLSDLSAIRGHYFSGTTSSHLIKDSFCITEIVDGILVDSGRRDIGSSVELYSKTGYTIEWTSQPSVTITNNRFVMPSNNVKFTGISSPLNYAVSVFLNGGTIASVPDGWALENGLYKKDIPFGTSASEIEALFSSAEKEKSVIEWISTGDSVGVYGLELSINWKPISYQVDWFNEDHSLLFTSMVEYGSMPVYSGSTPVKAPTLSKVYSFNGWNPAITTVSGPISYTAVYTESDRYYDIYANIDGNIINIPTRYGETPELPVNPAKPPLTYLSYVFEYWSPSVQTVTCDATYTAVFSTTPRTYTVTWVDDEGNTLDTSSGMTFGVVPVYTKGAVTKASTPEFSYRFVNWTPQVKAIDGDATYTAIFEPIRNTYKVTWRDDADKILEIDESVEYGSSPSYDGSTPVKYPTASSIYTFAGWDGFTAGTIVTSDMVFRAVFVPSDRMYTVSFNADGDVSSTQYRYGDTIVPPSNPVRSSDAYYDYSFDSWVGYYEGITVTKDVVFIAKFNAIPKTFDIVFKTGDETFYSYKGAYGSLVEGPESMPLKAADERFQYVFIGWNGFFSGISTVTGNLTYNAVFSPLAITHLIQFKVDDRVVSLYNLQFGAEITAPADAVKESTSQYEYEFLSWGAYTPGMTVIGPMTFDARFQAVERIYTISFVTEDNNETLLLHYGDTIIAPADPVKQGSGNSSYVFSHWNGFNEGMTVTGDAIFTAIFDVSIGSIDSSKTIVIVLTGRDLFTMQSEDLSRILAKLEEEGGAFSLDIGNGKIAFDSAAMKSFGWDSVSASVNDISASLNEHQKSLVGDRPVYDIRLNNANGEIHSFSDGNDIGKIEVSVRYDLRAGEDPDKLSVWYMSDGKLSEQRSCRYFEEDGLGYVAFETEHLSNYTVMYDSDSGSSEKEFNIWVFVGTGIVAVVAIAGAALFLRSRH